LEDRRGAAFTDAELHDALRSKEFAIEHEAAVRRFCSNASNDRNLACLQRTRAGGPPTGRR
jgi:hypothetical protein